MPTVTCEATLRATLGEGPAWIGPELAWVDILAHEVHLFDPTTGSDRAIPVGQAVGAAVPAVDGSLLLAVRDGFARLDPASEEVSLIASVEADLPGNRMNDGKCDSAGRFWAGTMSEPPTPGTGGLYRLELDGSVTVVLDDVTISNGLGWSPDDRLFYYIDTAESTIDVFDYDGPTGAIANRRVFARIPPGSGDPDGMAVDREGYVWVALWDGWALRRFAPDGTLDRKVRLPVSHVTSCAFGGPDLTRLYITTASSNGSEPYSPAVLAGQPLAGSLFGLDVPVPGLPVARAGVQPRSDDPGSGDQGAPAAPNRPAD